MKQRCTLLAVLITLLAGVLVAVPTSGESSGGGLGPGAQVQAGPGDGPQPLSTGEVQGRPLGSHFSVQPIQAVLTIPTTHYTAEFSNSSANPLFVLWTGPDCGIWDPNGLIITDPGLLRGTFEFVWDHPHPPCDPTTTHDNVTVTLRVVDPTGDHMIVCTYQGAGSGTGPPCDVVPWPPDPWAPPPEENTQGAVHILPDRAVVHQFVGPGLPSGQIATEMVSMSLHNTSA